MFWLLIGLLLVTFIWFNCKHFNYWTNKGVKEKNVFLLKDFFNLFYKKKSFAEQSLDSYNEFPDSRYNGVLQFFKPILLLRDIDLIKQITIKDFDYFTDHFVYNSEDTEPIWTRNLFTLKGDKWRDMRAAISPAFTGSKMRAMFVLMSECAQEVATYFETNSDECKSIELKDLFTRYTNDVIATCAFGVQCNSFKDKQNEFYMMGKLLTNFKSIWLFFKFFLSMLMPKLCDVFGITLFDKRIELFFRGIIKDAVKMREENNIIRPDLIHLLMEARKGRLNYDETSGAQESGFAAVEESDIGKIVKKEKDLITDDTITAQALIFFFAGFESVSTLMVLMAYEIVVNPYIQEKLQSEIDEVLEENDGNITYDVINKMRYLDMVTSETLRKWPATLGFDRVCVKQYIIPPVLPDEIPVTLNVGDIVSVSVYGIHRDPKYYPNPEKFDPERFNEENKVKIKSHMYLPFGSGPRNCIGSRFALLEAKVMFVHLLSKFNIVVTEKSEVPLNLSKSGFTFNSRNGFWFGLKLRE